MQNQTLKCISQHLPRLFVLSNLCKLMLNCCKYVSLEYHTRDHFHAEALMLVCRLDLRYLLQQTGAQLTYDPEM